MTILRTFLIHHSNGACLALASSRKEATVMGGNLGKVKAVYPFEVPLLFSIDSVPVEPEFLVDVPPDAPYLARHNLVVRSVYEWDYEADLAEQLELRGMDLHPHEREAKREAVRAPAAVESEPTREPRIRSFMPCSPGYFAVFYDVEEMELCPPVPVVGWAMRARFQIDSLADGSTTEGMRDIVEAMVLTPDGEAELVSEYYPLDDDGREEFRLLGITYPGDKTKWTAEMKRDAKLMEQRRPILREAAAGNDPAGRPS